MIHDPISPGLPAADIGDLSMEWIHLAEPYTYVPGWIELSLAFRG